MPRLILNVVSLWLVLSVAGSRAVSAGDDLSLLLQPFAGGGTEINLQRGPLEQRPLDIAQQQVVQKCLAHMAQQVATWEKLGAENKNQKLLELAWLQKKRLATLTKPGTTFVYDPSGPTDAKASVSVLGGSTMVVYPGFFKSAEAVGNFDPLDEQRARVSLLKQGRDLQREQATTLAVLATILSHEACHLSQSKTFRALWSLPGTLSENTDGWLGGSRPELAAYAEEYLLLRAQGVDLNHEEMENALRALVQFGQLPLEAPPYGDAWDTRKLDAELGLSPIVSQIEATPRDIGLEPPETLLQELDRLGQGGDPNLARDTVLRWYQERAELLDRVLNSEQGALVTNLKDKINDANIGPERRQMYRELLDKILRPYAESLARLTQVREQLLESVNNEIKWRNKEIPRPDKTTSTQAGKRTRTPTKGLKDPADTAVTKDPPATKVAAPDYAAMAGQCNSLYAAAMQRRFAKWNDGGSYKVDFRKPWTWNAAKRRFESGIAIWQTGPAKNNDAKTFKPFIMSEMNGSITAAEAEANIRTGKWFGE